MAAHLGAHEVMEVHEVLTSEINDINTIQLYRPHVKDPQLAGIIDKQLQFAVQGYNQLVQSVQSKGMQSAVPYRAPKTTTPTYGLHQPPSVSPAMSVNAIDDRDVASAILNLHKTGAGKKMIASLECADPQLRHSLQQSAVNCSEQAYEVWQYMNQQGYYQVPTMKEMTTNTMINTYQPVAGSFPTHTTPYGTSEIYNNFVSQTNQPAFGSQVSPAGTTPTDYSYGNYSSNVPPTYQAGSVSTQLTSQVPSNMNKQR